MLMVTFEEHKKEIDFFRKNPVKGKQQKKHYNKKNWVLSNFPVLYITFSEKISNHAKLPLITVANQSTNIKKIDVSVSKKTSTLFTPETL